MGYDERIKIVVQDFAVGIKTPFPNERARHGVELGAKPDQLHAGNNEVFGLQVEKGITNDENISVAQVIEQCRFASKGAEHVDGLKEAEERVSGLEEEIYADFDFGHQIAVGTNLCAILLAIECGISDVIGTTNDHMRGRAEGLHFCQVGLIEWID